MSGGSDDPFRFQDPFGSGSPTAGPTPSYGNAPTPGAGSADTRDFPQASFELGGFGPPGVGYPDGRAGGGVGPIGGAAVGGPPVVWLVVGLVLAAAGAVVAGLLGETASLAFAAWVAAGPIAIGMLALYVSQDTKQRARPVYAAPGWTPALYWGLVVVAGIGIVISAIRIALWAGRL